MLQQTKSIFLLFLFSIVTLFPGYGQFSATPKRVPAVLSSKDKEISAITIAKKALKKALAFGVSSNNTPVNEEERTASSSEEDKGKHSIFEGFIIPSVIRISFFDLSAMIHGRNIFAHHTYIAEIPSPPPNC